MGPSILQSMIYLSYKLIYGAVGLLFTK
jgi:hypothetical protein